ncbi:MAG: ATP-binding protein, partial [Bifidobacteriaceae bacterium]|nr:ATP-binding protein [Bifidobacteriaceae bacterium]
MIDQQTMDRLKMMRLSGMAACLEQGVAPGQAPLSGPDLVKAAVDWEWERRRNSKLRRLRGRARLAQPDADLADVKAMPGRKLDTELLARLATGGYIANCQDVVLQGPTGSGKTYVARALANRACQQSRSALYLTAGDLFDRIVVADRL